MIGINHSPEAKGAPIIAYPTLSFSIPVTFSPKHGKPANAKAPGLRRGLMFIQRG